MKISSKATHSLTAIASAMFGPKAIVVLQALLSFMASFQ